MIREYKPLYQWTRRYSGPSRIAGEIPAEMLGLRTRLLVSDIRARFGVCKASAMKAVAIARVGGAAKGGLPKLHEG